MQCIDLVEKIAELQRQYQDAPGAYGPRNTTAPATSGVILSCR